METSALLPIETNADRPRPRDSDASSSASPRAPLCDEKPMLPAGAERAAKVAFRLGPATASPRQFGPISRAPCARTAARSCSCRLTPSLPISANPAEMTTRARTPLAERLARGSEHRRARERDHREIDGVRDLVDRSGRRAHRRPAPRRGSRGTPHRRSRLSGCCGRARRRSSLAGFEAPITATLRGSKNGRREATTASWSRASTCSR